MKQTIDSAKEALTALPYWVKVMMWAQTILIGVVAFGAFSVVMETNKNEIVALTNVILPYLADEGVRAGYRDAIMIGVNARPWLYALLGAMTFSTAIGFVLCLMTDFKRQRPN